MLERTKNRGEAVQKREGGEIERVQERQTITPRVDIYENDQEVLLVADVPGVSKDQLKIHLEKDHLSIEGIWGQDEPGTLLSCEYRGVDYVRAFRVPTGLDTDKISADLKNGVLRLHLPKSESLKPRQIQIKAG